MRVHDFAITALRIAAGIGVGAHGLRKLIAGPSMLAGVIGEMGFPAPELVAWLVAFGETAGFLLAIGWFTRWAGLAVAMAMGGVAIFANGHLLAELGTGPAVAFEYSALLAIIGLYFAISGPLGWSVDGMLRKGRRRRAA